MANRRSILLFLVLTSSLSGILADIRKELRAKEVNQTIVQLTHSTQSFMINPSKVTNLSWRPRVFLYSGFLSEEECDHLISGVHGKRESFLETGDGSGNVETNKLPANSNVSSNMEDKIAATIEDKISAWTFLPKVNSKPLRVLHFGSEVTNQRYNYFGNSSWLEDNERLMATVVLYLSNVSQGGQVLFLDSQENILSDCTKSSETLRPTKGNAIVFFNLLPSATPDRSGSYARCPVLDVEMWIAIKLFYVKAIDREEVLIKADDDDCIDEDESCSKWAELGECQKNPVFMVGSPDYYGTCRKSCNAC